MARRHYIYLIPGFFGFADLGGITYFHHVREILETLLSEYSEVEPEIRYVATLPTGSIRARAYRLYEQIHETALDEGAPIHLIGHSTGGLDARLFASPNVSLLRGVDTEPIASRIQSVTTIAAPHLGTPLALFFNSVLGQKLLYALSLTTIYALRFGRFPLSALFSLIGVVARLDDHLGWRDTILDQFYANLFADFDERHSDIVAAFLDSIRSDQALLGQLTPGGIDLLNATTEDRAGVRYGCVITRARTPSLKIPLEIGIDPYRQGSHIIYRFMHWLTSFGSNLPEWPEEDAARIERAFGELPGTRDSDGVVPTRSQLHGPIIHTAVADHLDVCGHFGDPESRQIPPHVDWLASGSDFTRAHFERLWSDVVRHVFGAPDPAGPLLDPEPRAPLA